ncbi:GNAT family N-acetyltransferase [Simkania sp.]|uniref:GNAT family N-acetyltransferase n=1 Tax=Simkania sp. TaxID=34094 RepID=UPI003B516F3C
MTAPTLETKRLLLRHWKTEDLLLFAEMNADPPVMEYFHKMLSPDESNQLAQKFQRELEEKEYGLWAVEVKNETSFIGFVGLHLQAFEAHFTPCIEIGWRLAHQYWGKGYAYEAASKVLAYAFETLKLEEIVAFTLPSNTPSRKLMEKLGMTYDPKDDFENSKLPQGHPMRPHVLYRMKKS